MQSSIASVRRGRAGGFISVSMGPWQVWHGTLATTTWVRCGKKTWRGRGPKPPPGDSPPLSGGRDLFHPPAAPPTACHPPERLEGPLPPVARDDDEGGLEPPRVAGRGGGPLEHADHA